MNMDAFLRGIRRTFSRCFQYLAVAGLRVFRGSCLAKIAHMPFSLKVQPPTSAATEKGDELQKWFLAELQLIAARWRNSITVYTAQATSSRVSLEDSTGLLEGAAFYRISADVK